MRQEVGCQCREEKAKTYTEDKLEGPAAAGSFLSGTGFQIRCNFKCKVVRVAGYFLNRLEMQSWNLYMYNQVDNS